MREALGSEFECRQVSVWMLLVVVVVVVGGSVYHGRIVKRRLGGRRAEGEATCFWRWGIWDGWGL